MSFTVDDINKWELHEHLKFAKKIQEHPLFEEQKKTFILAMNTPCPSKKFSCKEKCQLFKRNIEDISDLDIATVFYLYIRGSLVFEGTKLFSDEIWALHGHLCSTIILLGEEIEGEFDKTIYGKMKEYAGVPTNPPYMGWDPLSLVSVSGSFNMMKSAEKK